MTLKNPLGRSQEVSLHLCVQIFYEFRLEIGLVQTEGNTKRHIF